MYLHLTDGPQGRLANDFAAYADCKRDLLEIYFSCIGFVYGKDDGMQFLRRHVQRAIEKEEHGYAMISVVEKGNPEQDMWNQQMIRSAKAYKDLKGISA